MPEAIEALSDGLEQPRSEIMTFLAAREAAHHRLFSHVPWLASQLMNTVEAYAKGIKIDMSGIEELAPGFNPASMADPSPMEQLLNQGIFEPKATPEQTAALERLETLLALIEGWVQTVVNAALGDRIPGAQALSETLRRRRATGGPAEQTFATLVGLELRPRKLREAAHAVGAPDRRPPESTGATACGSTRTCCRRAGDLDEPAGFIDRVIGGDTSGYRPGHRRPGEGRGRRADKTRRPSPAPVDSSGADGRVAQSAMTQLRLDPAMPVLSRPDGAVQMGWDPRRAVLVRPPHGLTTAALGPSAADDAVQRDHRRSAPRGHPTASTRPAISDLVASLVAAGVVDRRFRGAAPGPPRSAFMAAVRCPTCCQRAALLGRAGQPAAQPHAAVTAETTDLVVLADYLVADPRLVRDLHDAGVPHLLVRVRDGTGLVGPLVIPGRPAVSVRGPAPQRPRCGLARAGGAATRHRRQRRPCDACWPPPRWL